MTAKKKVADKTPAGAAYLDHEDPNVGASYMGAELARGENGFFLVPLHAVEALAAHGFYQIEEAE